MKWLVRGVFVGVLAVGGVVGACSSFAEAPSDEDGGVTEAGQSPTSTADANVDAADAADAALPPCDPDNSGAGTRIIKPQARDAVLDPKLEDAGARKLCDLSAGTCLIAFDLGADAKRRVFAATLTLKRAIGNDCQAPTDCGQHRTGGTVIVNQMRADWTEGATFQRLSLDAGSWDRPGATGAADTADASAQVSVAINDDANVSLLHEILDPRFAASPTNTLVAFRLTSAIAFPFVIRRIEYAASTAPDAASLRVQFCK